MLNAYKRRPEDFKRRILGWAFTRKDLLELESRWLELIKKEDLQTRYYNVYNFHFSHWSALPHAGYVVEKSKERRSEGLKRHHASLTPEEKEERRLRIQDATLRRKREAFKILRPLWDQIRTDLEEGVLLDDVAKKYDTSLQYLRDLAKENGFNSINEIKPFRPTVHSEETKRKISEGHKGKPKVWTEEGRARQEVALKSRIHTDESRQKRREKMTGIEWSEEVKAKRVEANKRTFQKKLDGAGFSFEILKEMFRNGANVKDVAERFKISNPTVTRIIKDHGFESPRVLRKSLSWALT